MTNAALLFLPLIVLSLVNAISWEGSRATEVDDVIVSRSPLPTGTQSESFEMVKRGQYPMTVCGFIGGSLNKPATCSSQSTCVWFSDYSVVGCCATASNTCTLPTSCIDGNSPPKTGADDPLLYTCHSQCYTNTYPIGYTQIGCGSSSWATSVGTDGAAGMKVFVTMTAGNGVAGAASTSPTSPAPTVSCTFPSAPNSLSSTSSSTPSSSAATAQGSSATSSSASSSASSSSDSSSASSSSASSSASSSSGSSSSVSSSISSSFPASPGGARGSGSSSDSGASAAGASTTSSSASPTTIGNGSSSNVGAIAGGAVGGGVAAIGAAAAVIFFMLRRFKRGKYQAPHNTNEPGSPLYGDKRLSQHTATPYGSPTPMYTPTMGSSHLPDPYGRPGSYQYNPINNQRYQPYRPPPAELPYNPSMPHELPER